MGNASVQDGVIRSTSVSQITSFDPNSYGGCPRKWYFRRVMRLQEEEGDAARKGTEAHARFDHYLSSGQDVLEPREREGKHLLPDPGTDLLIEWGFNDRKKTGMFFPAEDSWLRLRDVPLIGYIDVINARGEYVDSEGERHREEVACVEVIDHKTTSNIGKAAKASALVAKTVQMTGYAVWAALKFPQITHVRASHVYYQTAGKKLAVKRTSLVDLETAARRWYTDIGSVMLAMQQAAREVDPDRVEARPGESTCKAFHRTCAYADRCSAFGSTHPLTGGVSMSLLETLRAKNGAAPAAVVAAPAPSLQVERVTVPAGVFAPGRFKAGDLLDNGNRQVESVGADGSLVLVPAMPAPVVTTLPNTVPVQAPAPPVQATIVPPDVPKSNPQLATSNPIPLPTVPEEPKKTRAPRAPKATGSKVEGVAVMLDTYIAETAAKLASAFPGTVDIRCADAQGPLGFGKWKGALAALVRDQPPAPGGYVVFSGTELADVVIEALSPIAAEKGLDLFVDCMPTIAGVFRGIR